MKKGILLLVTSLLFFSCTTKKKYTPIVWENEQYQEKKELLNSEFCQDFKLVLTYYNFEFDSDNECEIKIPKALYNNKDMLMNLTTKAQDKKWLNTHIKLEDNE